MLYTLPIICDWSMLEKTSTQLTLLISSIHSIDLLYKFLYNIHVSYALYQQTIPWAKKTLTVWFNAWILSLVHLRSFKTKLSLLA